jgi:hypothetical protein
MLALDFGCVLRTTSALVLGFFPAVLPAQQVLAGGANLFASSPHVGRELDAARALPVTSFYATEGLKANADPGTLVGSEPATEYALPPGVRGSARRRVLQRHCTAGARVQRMSIRDLDTILWYMGPCETSCIGSLPGLLESPHQAIARRHRLSGVDMALEHKGLSTVAEVVAR